MDQRASDLAAETAQRIELLLEELQKAAEEEIRGIIASKLKEYGFSYVTLDLDGYRTGSMNEGLRPL